jgi:hypothetical protein
MKVYQIFTTNCGSIIVSTIQDVLENVKEELESEEINKIEIEIVEMNEEEFSKLPESNGC